MPTIYYTYESTKGNTDLAFTIFLFIILIILVLLSIYSFIIYPIHLWREDKKKNNKNGGNK